MKVNDTPLFDEKRYNEIIKAFDRDFAQLQKTQHDLLVEYQKLWALEKIRLQQASLVAEASLSMSTKALERLKKLSAAKPKAKAAAKDKTTTPARKPRKPKTT